MHKNSFISNFDSLKMQSTSHSIGEKFVFFNNDELHNSITQIAIGKLKMGETVPSHLHESMEEVFIFLVEKALFILMMK